MTAVIVSKLTTWTLVVDGQSVSVYTWLCAGVLSFLSDRDTAEHDTWLLAKETLFYDQMLHPRPSVSIITREDFYH